MFIEINNGELHNHGVTNTEENSPQPYESYRPNSLIPGTKQSVSESKLA